MADWIKIKNEYITTSISYRKLAVKHNVSFATLRARAEKENWVELRKTQKHKTSTKLAQKTADVLVDKEVNRIARVLSLSDRLSDKLEQAIDELDKMLVTHKTKTKTVEYNHNIAIGKPTKEIIKEEEELLSIDSIIDKAGLKQLASALKDIKDIQSNNKETVDTTKLDDILKAVSDVD